MTKPTLNADFVNIFAMAALETLQTQCSFKAKAGKPFLKDNGPSMDTAIAGVIGITSSKFRGSIALCFPEKTFLNVMSGMLGETYTKIDKDLEDGAAELLNIIFGCAKKSLAAGGHTVERAIPSVIKGAGIEVRHMSKAPILVVPFNGETSNFQIEIVLE